MSKGRGQGRLRFSCSTALRPTVGAKGGPRSNEYYGALTVAIITLNSLFLQELKQASIKCPIQDHIADYRNGPRDPGKVTFFPFLFCFLMYNFLHTSPQFKHLFFFTYSSKYYLSFYKFTDPV